MMKLLNCNCADKWGDIGLLFLRVALGAVFFMHGWQKVFTTGIPGVTGMLGSLGFPLPTLFAYILAYGELVVGAMMVIGLLTHWAAKYHIIVAFVALALVHAGNGFYISEGGYEFILLILAAAVAILTMGGGKYSADAMLFKKNDMMPAM